MTNQTKESPRPSEAELLEAVLYRMSNLEERLASMEQAKLQPDTPAPSTIPGYNLAEWFPEAYHKPGEIGGIVVDEGLARESVCRRVNLGDNELWYSRGVVGALSEKDKILYCSSGVEDVPLTPELQERQRIIREATTICQEEVQLLANGDRLQPFLKCMGKVASARGVQL